MEAEIIKKLEKRIQQLEDNYARLKRTYDDLLYNLDDDNLSEVLLKEKGKMKTQIKQSAESISLIAEDVSGLSADLTVQADRITTEVTNRQNADNSLQSDIEQTAESITLSVSKTLMVQDYTNGTSPYAPPSGSSKDILWHNTYNGYYYFWSNISSAWKSTTTKSISSHFTQTAEGFFLNGDVKLDGNLFSNGTIEGSDIVGGAFWDSLQNGYIQIIANGSTADLYLKRSDGSQVFKIYDGVTHIDLYGLSNNFLVISSSGVSAMSTWNFSGATAVNGLSTNTAGSHNHGIPDGTMLQKADGGTIEFNTSGSHSHSVNN